MRMFNTVVVDVFNCIVFVDDLEVGPDKDILQGGRCEDN